MSSARIGGRVELFLLWFPFVLWLLWRWGRKGLRAPAWLGFEAEAVDALRCCLVMGFVSGQNLEGLKMERVKV